MSLRGNEVARPREECPLASSLKEVYLLPKVSDRSHSKSGDMGICQSHAQNHLSKTPACEGHLLDFSLRSCFFYYYFTYAKYTYIPL